MGDCVDDILSTLTVNEEIDTYDDVKTALDEYFKVRRNVICERARFNKRTESPVSQLTHSYRTCTSCQNPVITEIRERT